MNITTDVKVKTLTIRTVHLDNPNLDCGIYKDVLVENLYYIIEDYDPKKCIVVDLVSSYVYITTKSHIKVIKCKPGEVELTVRFKS